MNLIEQLDYLFNPHSIAVVGVSGVPNKLGFAVFHGLLKSRGDSGLYPINSKGEGVLGIKGYKSIEEVPHPLDLAVIIVPSSSVPQVMQGCVRKGVKAAVVMAAGFAEIGERGTNLEKDAADIARQGGIRLVGPNCNGFFNTQVNIFSTFTIYSARRGGIGFISQSGNLGTVIIQYGLRMGLGFSKFISTGNEADLHFEDFLEYLGQDKETKVILGYVEGLREGRRFLSLAKDISKRKPIVLLKVGETTGGTRAAYSHTRALAGNKEVCDAAFKQTGVIRVEATAELLDVASVLLHQPLPQGRRVGILSKGGGFGAIAAESCEKLNLEVATLSQATIEKLSAILPPRWPHSNPVDVVGGIATDDSHTLYRCIKVLMEDENTDAILYLEGRGQDMPGVEKVTGAEELNYLSQLNTLIEQNQKPLLVSPVLLETYRDYPTFSKLQQGGITIYPAPERAAKALAHLVEYSEYLRGQS
jgi:acetyl coenzyme A synthetase (ADP forming)-like protein